MKNVLLILIVIVVGAGMLATAEMQYTIYMPLVQDDSADPTAIPTPADSHEWLYIGAAVNRTDGLYVTGITPGFCYDVVIDHWENDGKLVVLRSQEIPLNTGWCLEEYWGGDWPPPVYDEPTILPPPFMYGEPFGIVFTFNTKVVCGANNSGATLNCKEVK